MLSEALNSRPTDQQRDAVLAASVDERHLFADHASGAKADRTRLKQCLSYLKAGDVLVVWKLVWLGCSLADLPNIVTEPAERGIGFHSLTEAFDTTSAQGKLLLSTFGALAEYERALIRERVLAGLEAVRRRGRRGDRPPAVDAEKLEQIKQALANGASKANVCHSFGVARSTLYGTLLRGA